MVQCAETSGMEGSKKGSEGVRGVRESGGFSAVSQHGKRLVQVKKEGSVIKFLKNSSSG